MIDENRLEKLKKSNNPEQLLYEWTITKIINLKTFKEALKILKLKNYNSCDYCDY